MIPILILTVFAVFVSIIAPEPAAAWGPSTHILLGKNVLDVIGSNGFSIASILTSNPLDFLYGSVFADMNIGKKMLFFAKLAHNWRVGFKLLDQAETEQNRACAYGYLVHLAADTVAHNEFVPRKLIEQYHQIGKGHLYFETAFDALLPSDPSRESREIVKAGSDHNDAFLKATLERTLLSFNTNRKLYNGILKVNRNRGVKVFQKWRANNSGTVHSPDVEHYLAQCSKSVMDFLERERDCSCYAADPHGKTIIKQATRLRWSLRGKASNSIISDHDVQTALDVLR